MIFCIAINLLVILGRYLLGPRLFVLDEVRVKRFILDVRGLDRVEGLCLGLECPAELEVVLLLHVVHGECARPPQ